MQGEDKAPFYIRVLIGIGFFVLALSALMWFVYSAAGLVSALYNKSPVIEFDRGSMHLLGVGLALFFMFLGIVFEGLLEKKLSQRTESLLVKGMIAGVVIMFVLPYLVHYAVNKTIPKDQYIVCQSMSHQWMAHKVIVYTDNQITCDNLVKEEEIRLSKPWF